MTARIALYVVMDSTDVDETHFPEYSDLEASFRARLSEIFDVHGEPLFPHLLGLDLEEDDDDDHPTVVPSYRPGDLGRASIEAMESDDDDDPTVVPSSPRPLSHEEYRRMAR